jgi:hypothetical protein
MARRRAPFRNLHGLLLVLAGLGVAAATTHSGPVPTPPAGTPQAPSGVAAPAGDLADVLPAYIADKWHVDERRARRVVELTESAAEERSIDPLLALAVIAKESGFRYTGNPGDLSVQPSRVDPRRPHGLMQVAGRSHPEKMPVDAGGNMRLTSTRENIAMGVSVLHECIEREEGSVVRGLQCYNGNPSDGQARYARKVLRVREELRRAVEAAA